MADEFQEPAAGGSNNHASAAQPPVARNTSSRRAPKKRTKTGCLTCRKRRIKCGEEKPICNNCVKSKRICEGYAQRVIFKNPMGIFGIPASLQAPDAQIQQEHMRVPLYNDYAPLPAQQAGAAAQHPMLAPRPAEGPPVAHPSKEQSGAGPSEISQTINAPQFYYPAPPVQAPPPSWPTESKRERVVQSAALEYSQLHHPQSVSSGLSDSSSTTQYPKSASDRANVSSQGHSTTTVYNENPGDAYYMHTPLPRTFQASGTIYHHYPQQSDHLSPQFGLPGQFVPQSQAQIIYMEDEAEDYYDVDSDEEMVDQSQTEGFNQLNLIMTSANRDGRRLRSFTTYLNEPNVLANYSPSLGSTPLNNPKTARIFAHFIHSTGPSLSIFERHQTDPSIVLGAKVPSAQQGLWTYTLPLKALEHPALLQAILAVSSLQIANLQGVPTTVSLKHYHYALKRIGKAVGLPTRRKQIGTLAATELLAYYEVISADHSKWNSHVAGAAQLIREVDFAGTTRHLRAHRRRVDEQRREMGWSDQSVYYPAFGSDVSEDDPFAEKESSVDAGLISSIMGRGVNYDDFGRVEDTYPQPHKRHFTRKDIENFRIQCDLYWWFSKHDLFHSLISGDKLFMPFDLRSQCPPRAGIGRLDAIYGSADHLWLLLARVSDFGYRDRKRKLKAHRATGTDWRPNPGMFKFMTRFAGGTGPSGPGGPRSSGPPGPPAGSSSDLSRARPPGQGPPPPDAPPMYGMIPPQGPVRLPSGFDETRREQRESSEEDDGSEDVSYGEAEREWEEILIAMDTFAKALGRDFQPLPADVTPTISTPFGPALQYRTNTIAVVWGTYYAGRILLHRLHPSMPPAMMMAAGVAAPTTAEYAQSVGRIMAGIYYPQRYNLAAGSLSPTLGSCLTEMTLPIFFAAVQYVDPAQRGWIIAKLKDISRLTGWKTSDAIAGGCEKAWIVAAKHGRGPPYERSFEIDRIRAIHPLDILKRDHGYEGTQSSDDRRFVTVQGPDRAYLALGLLSLEGDMNNLEL